MGVCVNVYFVWFFYSLLKNFQRKIKMHTPPLSPTHPSHASCCLTYKAFTPSVSPTSLMLKKVNPAALPTVRTVSPKTTASRVEASCT